MADESEKAAAAAKLTRNYSDSPSANTKHHPHPNWRCKECNCPSDMTPMIRPGPLGIKTLCNACYIRWKVKSDKSKRGSARPNASTAAVNTPLYMNGSVAVGRSGSSGGSSSGAASTAITTIDPSGFMAAQPMYLYGYPQLVSPTGTIMPDPSGLFVDPQQQMAYINALMLQNPHLMAHHHHHHHNYQQQQTQHQQTQQQRVQSRQTSPIRRPEDSNDGSRLPSPPANVDWGVWTMQMNRIEDILKQQTSSTAAAAAATSVTSITSPPPFRPKQSTNDRQIDNHLLNVHQLLTTTGEGDEKSAAVAATKQTRRQPDRSSRSSTSSRSSNSSTSSNSSNSNSSTSNSSTGNSRSKSRIKDASTAASSTTTGRKLLLTVSVEQKQHQLQLQRDNAASTPQPQTETRQSKRLKSK